MSPEMRSINEMTLDEQRVLARYVQAIAEKDITVRLGLVDPEAVQLRLLADFDRCLRSASTCETRRVEAFKLALHAL